jgi:hypothetical protein
MLAEGTIPAFSSKLVSHCRSERLEQGPGLESQGLVEGRSLRWWGGMGRSYPFMIQPSHLTPVV